MPDPTKKPIAKPENDKRSLVIDFDKRITDDQQLNTQTLGEFSPLAGHYSSEFGESKYDDKNPYMFSEDIQNNMNEIRAQSQSGLDKTAKGLVRFTGRAATSAGELVGNVYGLGKLAVELNMDPLARANYIKQHGTLEGYQAPTWTTIFDNEVTRGLDQADAWIKSKNPLYESKNYQNATWYEKMQYANFYAGDLADAAGFAVGSMVGANMASKLTGNLFKLAKAGRLSEVDNISKAMKAGTMNEMQGAKAVDKIASQVKAIDNVQYLTDMTIAGTGESGQEARSAKDAIFKNIIDENITAIEKLNGYTEGPKKTSVGTLEDPNIKLLQAKQKYYKDDLLMSASFEQEILGKQRDLAVKQAELEKKSGTYIKTIKATYNQLILNSQAETGRKIIEEQHKLGVEENKEHEKIVKEKERLDKQASDAAQKINDRNLQNALTALKIESDVAIKIANASGKTTAADRIKILENYKSKLYELASTGGYTAEQFDKISDALVNVDAAIAGSQDKVKSFNITWIDTINNINSVIMDFINNSMAALGESIGKVLAGENIDVINVFGSLLADALTQIGKQLIALATASLFAWALLKSNNPITAAAALVAGIAAVAAGSFMKSKLEQDRTPKKFANGGIISGPTMGLMGEYPGAKTNPEVVAPLDKLKSMMGGGGGGEFVLRGNDLVLAMQRSNSSLKLRRG